MCKSVYFSVIKLNRKSISVITHKKILKKKNYGIISNDAPKMFDKIQYQLIIQISVSEHIVKENSLIQ